MTWSQFIDGGVDADLTRPNDPNLPQGIVPVSRGDTDFHGILISCTHPSKPGLRFVVEGFVTSTYVRRPGSGSRSAWTFSHFKRLVIEVVDGQSDTGGLFKEVGLGSMHNAIRDYFRDQARSDPRLWSESTALPKPGPRGHPDGHYAAWVKRILDARSACGRGYMKHLLSDHPGETRSNILRKLERAEALGLYKPTNEPGKLGSGEMTVKCRRLLQEIGVTA